MPLLVSYTFLTLLASWSAEYLYMQVVSTKKLATLRQDIHQVELGVKLCVPVAQLSGGGFKTFIDFSQNDCEKSKMESESKVA